MCYMKIYAKSMCVTVSFLRYNRFIVIDIAMSMFPSRYYAMTIGARGRREYGFFATLPGEESPAFELERFSGLRI